MPIGLECAGANRNDHTLLKATLDSTPIGRPRPTEEAPQGLCLDAGYDNAQSRELLADYGLTAHIRSRGEEIELKLRTPGWRARRWVVEAAHSFPESQSRPARALVEESLEPPRSAAAGQRPDRLQEGARRTPRGGPTGISS